MSSMEDFKTGDLIKVSQKNTEGKRERIVSFQGIVMKVRGAGENKMFTVREFLDGVGVDRIFPLNLPSITSIKVLHSQKDVRGNLPREIDLRNSKKYAMK